MMPDIKRWGMGGRQIKTCGIDFKVSNHKQQWKTQHTMALIVYSPEMQLFLLYMLTSLSFKQIRNIFHSSIANYHISYISIQQKIVNCDFLLVNTKSIE